MTPVLPAAPHLASRIPAATVALIWNSCGALQANPSHSAYMRLLENAPLSPNYTPVPSWADTLSEARLPRGFAPDVSTLR